MTPVPTPAASVSAASVSAPTAARHVLLTGAAGFIGGAVWEQLLARGHRVRALDVLLGDAHPVAPTGREDRPLHRVDLRDEASLTDLLDGVDVVCHQAAKVGLGVDVHDAPDYASHNVVGTATLLSAMARHGVAALVQASSMVVYGDGGYRCATHGDVRPAPRTAEAVRAGRYDPGCPRCGAGLDWVSVGEDARLDPRNTYAATKLAQEHLALAWAGTTGGRAVSLRYHNVYGPQMPRDTPYAGVASIFRSALAAGRAPQVYEDGAQMRDFVHVDDVAAAVVAAVEQVTDVVPGGGHTPLNVASGSPHSVLEMARVLAAAHGGPEPEVVGGGRPGDVRHVVADPAAATRVLGFTASTAFDEGMAAFAHAPLRGSTAG